MFKSFAVALGILTVLAMAPAQAEESKILRSITISGHGEVRAVPDIAVVSVGVTTQASTARDALDGNTKTMQALLETLKKAGLESRDMTTSNFSVGPRLDYGNNNGQPPKVVGYDVNNMLTITVRKIDDLGDLLDLAVSTGSNTINGIGFNISKPDTLLTDARIAAVKDARKKAETYASAGGFKLGNVVSITEGTAYQPPITYTAKAERSEASDAVPIAQGEQALSVDVSMTFEIK